jgi:hypothetical protein
VVAQTPNTAGDLPQPSAATLTIAAPQSVECPAPGTPTTPEPTDLLEHLIRQRQLDTELLALRAVRLRLLALELLESAAPETKDPVEKRKLAIAITRATNLRGLVGAAPISPAAPPPSPLPTAPPTAPGASNSGDARNPADPGSPPRPARPRRTPRPDDAPEHIISAIRASLQKPDEPDPGSDIATLRAHMAPGATFNSAPIPADNADFADAINQSPFADAREFRQWHNVAGTGNQPGGPDSRRLAFLVRTHDDRNIRLDFTLSRTAAPRGDPPSPSAPLWLITALSAT